MLDDSKKQTGWGCAGPLFRKLAKKSLVNNDGGLTWACAEWGEAGGECWGCEDGIVSRASGVEGSRWGPGI